MKNQLTCNRMICLILLCYFLFNTSCRSENNLNVIIEKKFLNYTVLHYRKGNFTNSKLVEYVVFLMENKKYQAPPNMSKELMEITKSNRDEISKHKDIDKIVVVTMKNNDIYKQYDLKMDNVDMGSLEYDKNNLEIITKGRAQFGTWDGYCYVNDFNGNGLDEILFFELSGRALLPFIFEFKDNSIQIILNITSIYNDSITELETSNENGKKMIKIYGLPRKGKKSWYKYAWDSGKQIYTLIDKGIE